jgi:uncharacterized OB-fold protein
MNVPRVAIAEGLFREAPEPHLLGSRCTSCGTSSFPQQASCPRCSATGVEITPLSRTGTLWTWTTQGFLPKSPPYRGREDDSTFQPWYVGYIELEEGLVVEGRLTGFDDRGPVIGEPLEVTVIPFATEDDGTEVTIYAFAPAEEGRRD